MSSDNPFIDDGFELDPEPIVHQDEPSPHIQSAVLDLDEEPADPESIPALIEELDLPDIVFPDHELDAEHSHAGPFHVVVDEPADDRHPLLAELDALPELSTEQPDWVGPAFERSQVSYPMLREEAMARIAVLEADLAVLNAAWADVQAQVEQRKLARGAAVEAAKARFDEFVDMLAMDEEADAEIVQELSDRLDAIVETKDREIRFHRDTHRTAPVAWVVGQTTNGGTRVWCPFCGGRHNHIEGVEVFRQAHCRDASALLDSMYFVKTATGEFEGQKRRCQAVTGAGSLCGRELSRDGWFCGQHDSDAKRKNGVAKVVPSAAVTVAKGVVVGPLDTPRGGEEQ